MRIGTIRDGEEPRTDRPNILLFMVDQMRGDAMGCAGNTHIRTPNLDRMAREGTRFANGYSNVPVCIPARHSVITGQPCSVHGRHDLNLPHPEPQLPSLAELLGAGGYLTHAIGKMHWLPPRRHFGFHRMELMEEIPHYRQDDEYLLYLKENGYGDVLEVHGIRNILYHLPQVSLIPEEHHGSTWVADRTIDFIKENKDRSFFCFSSWIAPHPPWNPPEPFASMYDPESLPLPVGWDRDPQTLPYRMRRMQQFADVKDASPEMLRRIKALYYGSISLIDKGVGRILDTLDELGLAENTLVIFTADHGEFLGDYHCFQKATPYKATANVPYLVRMPGTIEAGRVSEEYVSLLDIMPTALDLAEIPYTGDTPMLGDSLLGRNGGGLEDSRDNIVIEIGVEQSRWLSLRQGDWRYSYYLEGGWEELYHLGEDRHEMNNLLLEPKPEDRQRADDMKAYLTKWEKENGYSSSLDEDGELKVFEPAPVPDVIHNIQFPVWLNRLSPQEKAKMRSIGESLVEAIKNEDTFTLEDLKKSGSLEYWRSQGGSLKGTPYEHLLAEQD